MAENTLPLFADAGKFYVYVYRDPRPRKKLAPIYVGKGTAAQGRADVHWKRGARNPFFASILAKIRSEGREPIIEIVGWIDDEQSAFDLEKSLIEKFGLRATGAGTLCNLLAGNDGGGWSHSDSTKEKLRAARSRQPPRPCSSETALKISLAQKGRAKGPNPEHSLRLKGKKHSDEHRAAISKGLKGRIVSPETREKISQAQIGKTVSGETRAKLSEAHIGLFQTEKAKEKKRIAMRRIWADDDAWIERTAAIRAACASDEHRKKKSEAMKLSWARRRGLNDDDH